MKLFNLKDFILGWFIGNFSPTIIQTDQFEIAIKHYKTNDYEQSHHHKVATEITIVIVGKVLMNNTIYNANDIILIQPNESTDFKALETPTITCVIKIPSIKGDKYANYSA